MHLSARKMNVRVLGTYVQPLRHSAGFTLIELLVVLVIIGILLAIAVPAYSKLAAGARTRTAEQQIRAAMPAVQAFYLDNDTYVGLGNSKKKNPPGLAFYDADLSAAVGTGAKGKPTATTLLSERHRRNRDYQRLRPGADRLVPEKELRRHELRQAP